MVPKPLLVHLSRGGSSLPPIVILKHQRERARTTYAVDALMNEEKLMLKIKPVRPLWIDLASSILNKASPSYQDSLILKDVDFASIWHQH